MAAPERRGGLFGHSEFKKLEDADEDVAMVTSLNAMPKSYLGPMTMGLRLT